MSQSQYVRMLEKEIQKINKVIDRKIMQGKDYRREARDHRLMLRRMNYHNKRTFAQRMVNLFFRKDVRSIYA